MAFSEETISKAWRRAGGRCECKRVSHGHPYIRHNKQLVLKNRGRGRVWCMGSPSQKRYR